MKLTKKEVSRLVYSRPDSGFGGKTKWSAVGLVLAEHQVNVAALEKCMMKAWGRHKPASFRHLRNNRFINKRQTNLFSPKGQLKTYWSSKMHCATYIY
jgi:hypothetical protein